MTGREEEEEDEEAQAEVDMWKYIFGFANVAAVKCAIELGVADAIQNHHSPITLYELSNKLGCAPSPLHRIMRFLVHNNIFKQKPIVDGTIGYVQTPLSRRLLGRGENSMESLFLLESSPVMLKPWHFLNDRVRLDGNTAAFEAAHGNDIWKYAAVNPDYSKLIDDAMACHARMDVPRMIERCPEVFDGIKTLVDVGGGNGTTLSMLVKACPWILGINFDLPHVLSTAPEYDGIRHVGGDMFQSVPKADAAFLMWVLHNWNDDECIQILKKCKEAIPKDNGKVIMVEVVVGEAKDDKLEFVRLTLDMVMMAHTDSGKERTSKEWEYILGKAGFSRHTIRPIGEVHSVIEAFP
ncbi:acetylserotonin O-methyltransferase [Hevea brasiliensis]|uniref:acetylserotonin O-methyltransferase n=1 Tax=Hevea brasiliensis TaxID=3981 RepID=UPI0025EDE3A0|nr:acetylserotonin O-methyltransferase [Hevea brasiliensis]